MKMKVSPASFFIIPLIFLIISDCKKERDDKYEYPYSQCKVAMTVWIGMTIKGKSPGMGEFISTTSPRFKWIHEDMGLYNGSYGCKYDVYLGTEPGLLNKVANDLTLDSITLSGLNLNQIYYWKVIAKYDWLDSKGAHCSNTTETEIMSFATYQKSDIPSVITAPVLTHINTPPRVGGIVLCEGSYELIERGIYWGPSRNPELYGTKLQIGKSCGTYADLLTGLDPSTKYYIKAYARNSNGMAFGSEVSFTTGQNTTYMSVRDIDGNIYFITKIGKQLWMTENLRTTRYNDGTPIPYLTENVFNNSPGYSWYNNDAGLSTTYGALYKGYTIDTLNNNKKNVCPAGWQIPTEIDWKTLIENLGGETVAAGKLKELGFFYWHYPNNVFDNNVDFSALPAGIRNQSNIFLNIGNQTCWWTSSKFKYGDTTLPYYIYMYNNSTKIYLATMSSYYSYSMSIRCVKYE